MNLTPFVVIWALLAAAVLVLAIVRNITALHEDDNVHIAASEQQMIPKQLAFFGLLDRIDRWGKSLTVVTVATGLVLACIYLYRAIEMHNKLVG